MHEVLILGQAEADLHAAYCWFEAIEPALADRFDASVNDVIERISQFPNRLRHSGADFAVALSPVSHTAFSIRLDHPSGLPYRPSPGSRRYLAAARGRMSSCEKADNLC